MRVDVALTPALLPEPFPGGATVVVIDVVRAVSFMVRALAAGADGVETVADLEQARARARESGALLAGERDGLPPAGFDLGNSPAELRDGRCAGRRLVLTTTNGTAAVEAARRAGAGTILAGCLLNAEATARAAAQAGADEVLLLCAGSGGRLAADDVAAAGCMAGNLALLAAAEPGDGARVAAALFDAWRSDLPGLLARSLSGRRLARVGLSSDLALCSKVDEVPLAAARGEDGVFRRRP